MEIAMNNCYLIFDPNRNLPRDKLIELIDTNINVYYYVTLFISNTCMMLPEEH